MNFELTQDQKQMEALAREFTEKDLAPGILERDASGEFPLDLFKKFGKTGAYGLPYPKEVGGLGGSYLSYVLAVEEVSPHHRRIRLKLRGWVRIFLVGKNVFVDVFAAQAKISQMPVEASLALQNVRRD